MPPGKQGILINQAFADRRLKYSLLDCSTNCLKCGLNKRSVAGCRGHIESKTFGSQSNALYRVVPVEARAEMEDLLPRHSTVVPGNLRSYNCLLDVNPMNFERHHQLFYSAVAPQIPLYAFRIGEEVLSEVQVKRASQALNLKVWGTFSFRDLKVKCFPVLPI